MSKVAARQAQKIEVFCQQIMLGLSQSDAYRKAHPPSVKWKPETVHNEASKFVRVPEVSTRLKELQEHQLVKYDDTIDRIKAELTKMSFYDPRVFFDNDGNLKPLSEIPAEAAACITGLEIIVMKKGKGEEDGIFKYPDSGDNYIKKVKFGDKLKALELLGRLYNLWSTEREPGKPVVQQNDNRTQIINIYNLSSEEATRNYLELMRGDGAFNVTNKSA